MQMNFCRRCGAALTHKSGTMYQCANDHLIFLNPPWAVGIVFVNDKNEVLLVERAIDPGKGLLDVPGGFGDSPEIVDQAIARELNEEIGIAEDQFTDVVYLTSCIDPYEYKGETLPVLALFFTARLVSGAVPTPADDVASVRWVPMADIDMKKIYFPSVRKALQKLQS